MITRAVRPKYLGLAAILFEIRLPLSAWVSLFHRVSGVLLFAAAGWLLYVLDRSLTSEDGFQWAKQHFSSPFVKFAALTVLWAYCHHFCAGIRFLLLDMGVGIDRRAARLTAALVFVTGLGLTTTLGWLFLW